MRRLDRPLIVKGSRKDPFFGNVVLLQNCTEAAGATTFIDSSQYARTITTLGSAVMSATSPPSGATGSITMSGTNDAYSVANSTDLDLTSIFTAEAFLKPTNATPGTLRVIGGLRAPSGNDNGIFFYISSSNLTNLVVTNGGSSSSGAGTVADFSSSEFRHFMVSGDNVSYYIGVNGVIVAKFSLTQVPGASNGQWMWGSWSGESGTRNWAGQIGPTRTTKKACRYSGNIGDAYPVPTLPFPTS